MTQIILKNQIEQKKLETLLFLLNSWEIDAEIKETTNVKEKVKKDTSLTLSVGLWKDRNINDQELRNKAWGVNKRLAV
ncbi:hypothetical protein FACS1894162_4470 [Bacteroidia bacterium]|nr:hypothetical protein FACS1894162_4470 [Bacteroidia bacterium]